VIQEVVLRKWILLVSLVGTLALAAGLHHIVVLTARDTTFAKSFSGTCQWCHGDKYSGFGH
jgi:hypothetical protein